jgi:DNA-directed RNA polymerase subunit F
MSLHKLARELDETARQTAGMVEEVTQALEILGDSSIPADEARRIAARMIIHALQGQDRIEQRSQNMAHAVRQFALLPPDTPAEVYDEIWSGLVLDELRVPTLSGTATHGVHGEAELF